MSRTVLDQLKRLHKLAADLERARRDTKLLARSLAAILKKEQPEPESKSAAVRRRP